MLSKSFVIFKIYIQIKTVKVGYRRGLVLICTTKTFLFVFFLKVMLQNRKISTLSPKYQMC